MSQLYHVKQAKVKWCNSGNCKGDEKGCPKISCRKPRWLTLTHKLFWHYYERCPWGCRFSKR